MADCTFDCGTGTLTLLNSLKCIHVDGHKSTQPRKIRGMGNKSIISDLPKMTFQTMVKTADDMTLVYDWWVNDLDYGYKPFAMNTYWMGFNKEIEVRFTKPLESISVSSQVKDMTFEVEILTDLSAEVRGGLEAEICAILANCGE